MATDEDRREVARRLRGCRGGWSSGECYYTIIHALGLPDTSREDGGNALYSVLADLIDPAPTSSDTAQTCDRETLLALADEMDAYAFGPDMYGNVDARNGRMVPPAVAHGYARRIREACVEAS